MKVHKLVEVFWWLRMIYVGVIPYMVFLPYFMIFCPKVHPLDVLTRALLNSAEQLNGFSLGNLAMEDERGDKDFCISTIFQDIGNPRSIVKMSEPNNNRFISEWDETRPSSQEIWNQAIKQENSCRDRRLIMVEIFFGVHASTQRLMEHSARVCATTSGEDVSVYFDLLKQLQLFAAPFLIDHLFSHPQYKYFDQPSYAKLVGKFFDDIQKIVTSVLNTAEEHIIARYKQLHSGNHSSFSSDHVLTKYSDIPVLCYSYTLSSQGISRIKETLFYFFLRRSINHYVGKGLFRFFTTPRLCRPISSARKLIGNVLDLSTLVLEKYKLEPFKYSLQQDDQHNVPTILILGSDRISFVKRLSPRDRLGKMVKKKIDQLPNMKVSHTKDLFLAVPFANLGLLTAPALLLRLFCTSHDVISLDNKICHFPCFQKGWVQPFKGVTTRYFSQEKLVNIAFQDVQRISSLCNLSKDKPYYRSNRLFCSHNLHFNSNSTIFHTTGGGENDCDLVVGEGNSTQCRHIIEKYLLSDELPFLGEAIQLQFTAVKHIQNINPAKQDVILIRGALSPAILFRVHQYNFLKEGTFIKKERSSTHSSEFQLSFSTLGEVTRKVCETELLSMSEEEGRNLGRSQSCFRLCFVMELLKAAGAYKKTTVIFDDGQVLIPGPMAMMQDEQHSFIEDIFKISPDHWKSIYNVSEASPKRIEGLLKFYYTLKESDSELLS